MAEQLSPPVAKGGCPQVGTPRRKKSVSIDTSGDGLHPIYKQLAQNCAGSDALKIECILITTLAPVQLIALSQNCDNPGGFLVGSILFWMHPPLRVSPLLGIPSHCIGFASRCVGCLCRWAGNRLSVSGCILSLPDKEKAQNPLFSGSALVLYAI